MREQREHSLEFRLDIVKRLLAGESGMALSQQYGVARSLVYRWRDTYREEGEAGLNRPIGRPAGKARRGATSQAGGSSAREQKLRGRIAELERKVGQQAVAIDFFRGVFKHLEELPKAKRRGGAASTRRSDA